MKRLNFYVFLTSVTTNYLKKLLSSVPSQFQHLQPLTEKVKLRVKHSQLRTNRESGTGGLMSRNSLSVSGQVWADAMLVQSADGHG